MQTNFLLKTIGVESHPTPPSWLGQNPNFFRKTEMGGSPKKDRCLRKTTREPTISNMLTVIADH